MRRLALFICLFPGLVCAEDRARHVDNFTLQDPNDKAVSLGVSVQLNCRVSSIQCTSSGLKIVFKSRPEVECDLVVGADGLWSKCRESLLQRADEPLPTGDLAYRIVLDVEKITDPDLKSLVANPQCHFWIGPHSHAVGYSVRGGTMYNLVLLCPDDLPGGLSRTAGSVDEMRALFAGWDPILTRLLEQVVEVDKWKLMHREEVASWTNQQKNFVLIGDSCHPMLPYLAQGANSSIEDGGVLGRLLSYAEGKKKLPWAITLYESLRKPRSERIVRETFNQRDAFHMPEGPEQKERDRIFASQLGRVISQKFPSRWWVSLHAHREFRGTDRRIRTCPDVQPWLYGYDAYREADAAVKSNPFTSLGKL